MPGTDFPKPLVADIADFEEGVAIVIDGDEAPKAITTGKYLFIKNHSTLPTGGYHATADIASGADITSSNVAADADGIVNGAFGTLNSNIALKQSEMKYDSASLSFDSTYGLCTSNIMGYNRKIVLAWAETGAVSVFQNSSYHWCFVAEFLKGQTVTIHYYYFDA